MKLGTRRKTEYEYNKFSLSDRGRLLVEALPDRAKVSSLRAKWAREDRAKKPGAKR